MESANPKIAHGCIHPAPAHAHPCHLQLDPPDKTISMLQRVHVVLALGSAKTQRKQM